MNRREMLKTVAAAALTSGLPAVSSYDDCPLMITQFPDEMWAAVDAVIEREKGRIGLTDLIYGKYSESQTQ